MQNFLNQVAGCSPCACGIIDACPGYIAPWWYIVLGIAVLGFVGGLIMIVKKVAKPPISRKKLQIMTILMAVIALVMASLIAYKIIVGIKEDKEYQLQYEACQSPNAPRNCEY